MGISHGLIIYRYGKMIEEWVLWFTALGQLASQRTGADLGSHKWMAGRATKKHIMVCTICMYNMYIYIMIGVCSSINQDPSLIFRFKPYICI